MLVKLTPAVNFINIFYARFLYKSLFGSIFYLHVGREKLPKRHLYKKFMHKILAKLTPRSSSSLVKVSCHFGSIRVIRIRRDIWQKRRRWWHFISIERSLGFLSKEKKTGLLHYFLKFFIILYSSKGLIFGKLFN